MSLLFLSPTAVSCTVFHVSNDTFSFGGNNEDYSLSDTNIYFYPPTEKSFGKVIVGYTGLYKIQGGMNEKGLFWDGLATPYLEVIDSINKPYFNGHIIDYILDTCETCDEALQILDQYNLKIFENAQILMGDKYGDSFIIEGDIIHRKSEYYQVATNFYLSQHPNPPYPCWRYTTALDMFENNPRENLSVDFCASVLKAVHQEGPYPTQYSTVYDLKNQYIYLYYFHDFSKNRFFNLSEESALGYHSYSIADLFKNDTHPPFTPNIPEGPTTVKKGETYTYSAWTTDPDDDDIYYLFDWSDGNNSIWLGPFSSGVACNINYSWENEGIYKVKVKAKDDYGFESGWSDPIVVSMTKSKIHINPIIRFLQNHPILYQLLQEFFEFI